MSYNRLERGLASLLDAAPGVRRLAKSGYQRINYLLRGGRASLCSGISGHRGDATDDRGPS